MKIQTAKSFARALNSVLQMAIENSCCCGDEVDGRGYLGHDTSCYVHQYREQLKKVFELEESLKRGDLSVPANVLRGIIAACATIKAGGADDAFGIDDRDTRRDYAACEEAFDWAHKQKGSSSRERKVETIAHIPQSDWDTREGERLKLERSLQKGL